MSQTLTFMDCRGLSAPLTVLRIKQAMTGRADSLPLDVVIDHSCCDGSLVADCLGDDCGAVRLLHVAGGVAPDVVPGLAAAMTGTTERPTSRRPHA
ncbi:hypothetical protein [Acidimangrovimonas pyrenivorans]|uniref:Uncharacterized protein n=1 Tax=Acidimangrovimonas pyrenivorans TaxID=2030798 RepID=A0ABV7AD49_9RHOB